MQASAFPPGLPPLPFRHPPAHSRWGCTRSVAKSNRSQVPLPGWGKKIENGPAQARLAARERLQHSQSDPELAGVRDSNELARLPNEEREQWERLWSEVDALHRRVSGPE
jgi:hypothetical protein